VPLSADSGTVGIRVEYLQNRVYNTMILWYNDSIAAIFPRKAMDCHQTVS